MLIKYFYHAMVTFVVHTCCGSGISVIVIMGYNSALFKR
jgi:hypothetical protein